MRVRIDARCLDEDAANWWRRLSPARRAVLIQALFECGHGEDEAGCSPAQEKEE